MVSPPPGDRSATTRFYRPELDVLRFFAFLLVFTTHIVPQGGRVSSAVVTAGRYGVCLFFLLSAYLITELLERESDQTKRIDLSHFYIRRILRIWPLYFSALLLGWLIDLPSPTRQLGPGRMLAYLLLAGNWYTVRYGLPASFVGILWSVSVEEQFYLVWPTLRKFLHRRALLLAGWATFPLSYVVILLLCTRHGAGDKQLWFNTFVQAQFFGIGGLLALRIHGRSPRFPHWVRGLFLLSGLFLYFAAQFFLDPIHSSLPATSYSGQYVLALAGTVLLFFAALGLTQLRHARVLLYLGKISYGLYVFHVLAGRLADRPTDWLRHHTPLSNAVLQWERVVLALALTVLLAHFSYRYLETPFLRLKDRFTAVRTRTV